MAEPLQTDSDKESNSSHEAKRETKLPASNYGFPNHEDGIQSGNTSQQADLSSPTNGASHEQTNSQIP